MPLRRLLAPRRMALATLLLGLASAPARADLIVQALDSVAGADGTGSFDVVLSDTDPTAFAPYAINSFSVEVSVDPGSGVSFTAIDTATTAAPYLFRTLQSPPFTFSIIPTTDVAASDFAPAGTAVTVNPGDEYGLAHVTYAGALGANGSVTVTVEGAGTALSDVYGNTIPSSSADGGITPAAVPEPSSLVLGALGVAVLLTFRPRRRG